MIPNCLKYLMVHEIFDPKRCTVSESDYAIIHNALHRVGEAMSWIYTNFIQSLGICELLIEGMPFFGMCSYM